MSNCLLEADETRHKGDSVFDQEKWTRLCSVHTAYYAPLSFFVSAPFCVEEKSAAFSIVVTALLRILFINDVKYFFSFIYDVLLNQ